MMRFWVLSAAVAMAAACVAGSTRLINRDSLSMYRQAVAEKNRSKAEAMIHGLLIDSVKVGIDRTTLQDSAYEAAVQDGIRVWNEALGEKVFTIADSSVTADVVVRFVPRVKDGDNVQGYIQAQRHFFWNGKTSGAKIVGTIQIRDNIGRRYLGADEVSRVMAHELGHLLGLDDDPDGNGLMGDFVPGRGLKQPSGEELDSVIDFRDMLRAALTVK